MYIIVNSSDQRAVHEPFSVAVSPSKFHPSIPEPCLKMHNADARPPNFMQLRAL